MVSWHGLKQWYDNYLMKKLIVPHPDKIASFLQIVHHKKSTIHESQKFFW